jgi:hypothetical protein
MKPSVLELKQCWLFRFSLVYLRFLLLPSLSPLCFLPRCGTPPIEPAFEPIQVGRLLII